MMELVSIINKYYDKLNENDLYMLQYILEHKMECQDISITQLSKKINMSTSSILRMTQKLGFSGYSEFKFALKKELTNNFNLGKLNNHKNYIDVFKESINNTFKHFQSTDVKDIIQHINSAQNIYIYGTGWAQKLAGEQLIRIFLSCNRSMVLIKDYNEFKAMMSNYTTGDFIIIISLSGNIQHIIEDLRILKLNDVPTLSITDFNNNQLASLAMYNLYYHTNEVMSVLNGDFFPLAISMGSLQVLCELLYLKYIETYF